MGTILFINYPFSNLYKGGNHILLKAILSNKKIRNSVVTMLFIAISYGGYVFTQKATEVSAEVQTFVEQRVTRGDITIDFVADGEAEIPVVNLDFEMSGKLKELFVDTGQQIKKGDVVAKLDDTEYVNKLESAQIQYKKAVTRLEQIKEQYELNFITEKQKLDDLKFQLDKVSQEYLPMLEVKDVYSKQEIELKKVTHESAKLAYESQLKKYNIISKSSLDIEMERANVESAKITLKSAQDDLDNTVLKAPIDAKVLSISYKPGETVPTVTKSEEVTADTTHLMVISDAEKIEVTVPVSEIDLENIAIDQNVEIEFEAFRKQNFSGKVVSIASLPLIDNNGLVTYDVIIELNGGLDKIKTGMTCTVSFILNQRKNVLIIPNKAVSIVEGKQVVQVKDEQGNITSRTVKTAFTDGINVEVIEGLEVGEVVMIKEKR